MKKATETAYKNGYEKGKADATEHTKARLQELYDDVVFNDSNINVEQRLQDILEDL